MDKLQVFKSGMFEDVRATMIDGEPWFVGSDVARALDYDFPVGAIHYYVDEEDILKSNELAKTNADLLMINEPGVYALIFGSKQERAKAFKRWVTHEVLPALRQTGQYSVGQAPATAVSNLTGEQQIELTKILSEVSAPNLPYVIHALKSLGIQPEAEQKLLPETGGEQAKEQLKSIPLTNRKKYPYDYELVYLLNQFHEEKLSLKELTERAFVPYATIRNLRKGYTNTCPEFATRIKAVIREMFAEHGIEARRIVDPFRMTYETKTENEEV